MKRIEKIKEKELSRIEDLRKKQAERKLVYYFIFSNPIAFRDFWAPRMVKRYYKTRFYQYAPALSKNMSWGGARTLGKTDELVFSMIFNAIRSKMKESLLTAFRRIHVKKPLESVIGFIMNVPYLRKFFRGDADTTLKGSVTRTPIYSIRFKNGHEIKGISIGEDPAAVMIQGTHPDFRYMDEGQTYPEASWVKFQSTQSPLGSIDRYFGTVDGRLNTPFFLINHKLSKFKGNRFFIPRMLEPWFDREKKKDYIQAFGSEQSNEYQQQVLALEGEPIWSLWSQRDILKNIDMTETRSGVLANFLTTIKISQGDIENGMKEKVGDSKDPELLRVALNQLFEDLFSVLPSLPDRNAEVILGIDAGWSEPTVILPLFFYDNKWNLHCKILLTDKMIPDFQTLAIDFVASKYNNSLVSIDTSDGEGKALATSLSNPTRTEFAGKGYLERVVWVEFQKKMITGYMPDETPIEQKVKERTTKELQNWFSEVKFKIYHDEDFLADFDKEVRKKTSTGYLIFTPPNVHIPEALRVFIYAWLEKYGKIDIPQEGDEFEDYQMIGPEKGNLDFDLFGRQGERARRADSI